jgi:fatty-acyl-CoA synthase
MARRHRQGEAPRVRLGRNFKLDSDLIERLLPIEGLANVALTAAPNGTCGWWNRTTGRGKDAAGFHAGLAAARGPPDRPCRARTWPRAIVSRWADGRGNRTTWAGIRRDALKMRRRWIGAGDRMATLANHATHLVAWYGAGAGGVLHTLNPRLFDDQLAYIVNHAEDRPAVRRRLCPAGRADEAALADIEHYVCFDPPGLRSICRLDRGRRPKAGRRRRARTIRACCATPAAPPAIPRACSTRTVRPCCTRSPRPAGRVFGMDAHDDDADRADVPRQLGPALGGAAAGAKFVYSAVNDGRAVRPVPAREGDSFGRRADGVAGLSPGNRQVRHGHAAQPEAVVCGGSAVPSSMIERFMGEGIRVAHAWGMTETSPIGTTGTETWDWDDLSFAEQIGIAAMQGRVPFGVDTLPSIWATVSSCRDGKTAGACRCAAGWSSATSRAEAVDTDQWFDTGDVVIHPTARCN